MPGKPKGPADEPQVESREPTDIQVEPGRETGTVTSHTQMWTQGGVRRDVQDDGMSLDSGNVTERVDRGETWSARAHTRSTSNEEENDHHHSSVQSNDPVTKRRGPTTRNGRVHEPDCETAAPGDRQSIQERPRGETNASSRDRGPGHALARSLPISSEKGPVTALP